MSRNNWANDLKQGERAEDALAHLCTEEGWMVLPGPRTHVYDKGVINQRRIHLVEVKDESNYAHSPNLCIELYRGPDKTPSGLATSEATLTVHLFGSMWALYRTQCMRVWMKQAMASGLIPLPATFGDADNATGGILVARSTLMRELWYDQQQYPYLCRSELWLDDGRDDNRRP
jgi:hypothetical protein